MTYRTHHELPVYQASFAAARQIFQLSRHFPKEETYSLTDQIRRSSRSVCANVAEAWRKRRFEKHFVSTLNIAEAEASETQVWIDFAEDCEYLAPTVAASLSGQYDQILAQLVYLIRNPTPWLLLRH